jgi:hypothetical protein
MSDVDVLLSTESNRVMSSTESTPGDVLSRALHSICEAMWLRRSDAIRQITMHGLDAHTDEANGLLAALHAAGYSLRSDEEWEAAKREAIRAAERMERE